MDNENYILSGVAMPVGERILVRPIKQAATTKSGIYTATDDEKEKEEGHVVGISDDAKEFCERMHIDVGSVVIFGKYAGDDYSKDSEKLKFLKIDEVLGVMKSEKLV